MAQANVVDYESEFEIEIGVVNDTVKASDMVVAAVEGTVNLDDLDLTMSCNWVTLYVLVLNAPERRMGDKGLISTA